jgi:hypothetical protein
MTEEIHRTDIRRELPVKLTDEEMFEIHLHKCKLEDQLEEAEQDLADVKADWKTKIEVLESQIAEKRGWLRTGEQKRVVKCYERWRGNLLEVVREDTSAVVDTRTSTLKDTQPDLPELAQAQADAAKTQSDAGVSEDDDGNVIPLEGDGKKRKRGSR